MAFWAVFRGFGPLFYLLWGLVLDSIKVSSLGSRIGGSIGLRVGGWSGDRASLTCTNHRDKAITAVVNPRP